MMKLEPIDVADFLQEHREAQENLQPAVAGQASLQDADKNAEGIQLTRQAKTDLLLRMRPCDQAALLGAVDNPSRVAIAAALRGPALLQSEDKLPYIKQMIIRVDLDFKEAGVPPGVGSGKDDAFEDLAEKLTGSRLVGRDTVAIMSDTKGAAIGFGPAGFVESAQAMGLPGLIVKPSGKVVKAETNHRVFGPPLIPARVNPSEAKQDAPALGQAALVILDACIAVAIQDATNSLAGPPATDIAGLILLRERVARYLDNPKPGR